MKAKWIPTNEIYREIIAAPDMQTKRDLYRERILKPFAPIMQMMSGMSQSDPDDEYGVARAWHWLLSEDLTAEPESLKLLEAADAWTVGKQALEQGITCFEPFTDRMTGIDMDEVEGWLMLANPADSDPHNKGYTGAIDFTMPRLIGQFDTPNDYNLSRLPGLIAHEFHHLVRLRLFPWDMMNTSVADYIIHEGLAESFATELYGADKVGYFIEDITDTDLNTARDLIADSLEKTGFNTIRSYIFGDRIMASDTIPAIGMPDFGGYAVGYHVVQAYLHRTGQSIVEATFTPADEIVVTSDYFNYSG